MTSKMDDRKDAKSAKVQHIMIPLIFLRCFGKLHEPA